MKTDTRNKIFGFIKEKGQTTPKEIIKFIGFGAPAVFRQLKKLTNDGLLAKTGTPPMVRYHLPLDISVKKIDNMGAVFSTTINVCQFGNMLSSRVHGMQAWLLIYRILAKKVIEKEKIIVNFDGVQVMSPGWADEFLSSLTKRYPNQTILLPSNNASVKMSLEFVGKRK